jgi:hypothetical protein
MNAENHRQNRKVFLFAFVMFRTAIDNEEINGQLAFSGSSATVVQKTDLEPCSQYRRIILHAKHQKLELKAKKSISALLLHFLYTSPNRSFSII